MLSRETESQLSQIFLILNEYESKSESAKLYLNNLQYFSSYKLFKKLDTEKQSKLFYINIYNFLINNSINCNTFEVKQIIKLFDTDNDNYLNYNDFLYLISSNENHKKFLSSNINNFDSNNNFSLISISLPYNIQYAFCKVLENELELVRILIPLIKILNKRLDFSLFDLINELSENDEILSVSKLKIFLNRNNINLTDEQFNNILKRLDINKDGYVTFEDLSILFGDDIFNTENNTERLKYFNIQDINYNDSSKPKNIFPIIKELPPNYHEIIKNMAENDKNDEFPKIKNVKVANYIIKQSLYEEEKNFRNNFSKEILKEFFIFLMEIEYSIENSKIDLMQKNDFNFKDLFDLFINNSSSSDLITDVAIKDTLYNFGLITNNIEIFLLIKRYSFENKNNNFLNKNEFFNLIMPFDETIKKEVEGRKSQSHLLKYNKYNVFMYSTKDKIRDLFKLIISSENEIEKKRQMLKENYDLNFLEFYNIIDKEDKGYLLIEDFYKYFGEINKEIITKTHIDLLFKRLDWLNKGKIMQGDLMYEIIPRVNEFIC